MVSDEPIANRLSHYMGIVLQTANARVCRYSACCMIWLGDLYSRSGSPASGVRVRNFLSIYLLVGKDQSLTACYSL